MIFFKLNKLIKNSFIRGASSHLKTTQLSIHQRHQIIQNKRALARWNYIFQTFLARFNFQIPLFLRIFSQSILSIQSILYPLQRA